MNVKIGFPGALGLVFITLKLIGTIDWSWWWVLAPFWIFPAITLTMVIVYVIVEAIVERR
jgi:hypothetical protein